MSRFVEVSDAGAVRTIRLNRTDRLNALGGEVLSGLQEAVSSTADCDARVVVLEGAGRAFSAGADLKGGGISDARSGSWQQRRRAAGAWGRLLDAMEALPQVTVASVHGYAIGGAMLVVSACDMRVAAEDTIFSIPEVAIGLPLTWGGVPRLVRDVGLPRARELILTGRRLTAREALDWGFVHRVGDRLVETARMVSELLSMPEAPLAMSKEALRAYGRTLVSMDASWADPDLISWSGREPESAQAAADYASRTINRKRDQ
jgi:enoyl-CoA hydratase/carnithine racemase